MSAAIQTNIFLRGNFIEFNLDTHILLACHTSVSYLRAATPKYTKAMYAFLSLDIIKASSSRNHFTPKKINKIWISILHWSLYDNTKSEGQFHC